MKKYFRIPAIGLLLVIIAIFAVYTLISVKSSLLSFALNFYLKKYQLTQHFDKLTVNSPSSLTINQFVLRKKNLFFKADKLFLEINKNGEITAILKNPVIVVSVVKGGKKTSYFSIPPLKLKLIKFKNLKLRVEEGKKDLLEMDNTTVSVTKNLLNFKGRIYFSKNRAIAKADIKKLDCSYGLFKNSVTIRNIKIVPSKLYVKSNNLQFLSNKPIEIKNITIRFLPFSISLNGLDISLLTKVKGMSVSYKADINYRNKKASVLLKDVRTLDESMKLSSLRAEILFKKKLKILSQFDNLTINKEKLIAQGVGGQIFYENAVKAKIKEGQAIAFDNLFFDFSNNPLSVVVYPKDGIIKSALGKIVRIDVKNIGEEYRLHAFSDNLTNLMNFLNDSFDEPILREIYFHGKQDAEINVNLNKKKKAVSGVILLNIDNLSYQGTTLKDIKASIPISLNSNVVKKGEVKIALIKVKKFTFPLIAYLVSKSNTMYIRFNPIKVSNFDVSPFHVKLDIAKKALDFSTVKAKIVNKLLRVFVDIRGSYRNGVLNTKGYVKVKAFDGFVDIKHIRCSFKELPILYMDVFLNHLNLKKITENTNFGLITGFVKGYVKKLSLVNFRYPLSFEAMVKTENVKGVSKRISLKAVNSISSVGGGIASIAIPFFKSFPYSGIGFVATLRNNRFQIHGLYKSGNVEYIVKKGFIVGVNVINVNRNSSIRWADFLDRLKRVLKRGGKK